jgi:hypothetical protein
MLKDFKDKKHQPITLKEIREQEAAEERRLRDAEEKKLRDAENALTGTHRKLFELEKAEVLAGRPDPGFVMPEQIKSRQMTVAKALKFATAESKRFAESHPEYYRCDKNSKIISDYLWSQGVQIPDFEAYEIAFERCRYLGILSERPEPVVEAPVEQPEVIEPEQKQDDGLTAGFDLVTGTPREYTQAEIWKMSSSDMKKAFKLWVTRDEDRRPLLKRSRYL